MIRIYNINRKSITFINYLKTLLSIDCNILLLFPFLSSAVTSFGKYEKLDWCWSSPHFCNTGKKMINVSAICLFYRTKDPTLCMLILSQNKLTYGRSFVKAKNLLLIESVDKNGSKDTEWWVCQFPAMTSLCQTKLARFFNDSIIYFPFHFIIKLSNKLIVLISCQTVTQHITQETGRILNTSFIRIQ